MNSTEVFNKGYVAGYNQALVDKGFMSQEEADKILRNWNDTQLKQKIEDE